jgi:hypothetical protein
MTKLSAITDQLRGIKEITRWSRLCGIYFLFNDDELLYIGKSTNVLARIAMHAAKSSNMKFDRAFFIPVNEKELDIVEKTLIHMFGTAKNTRRPDFIALNDRAIVAMIDEMELELPLTAMGANDVLPR